MSILHHLNSSLAFIDSLEAEAKTAAGTREARLNALEEYLFREKKALHDFIEKTFEDLVLQVTSYGTFEKDGTRQELSNFATLRSRISGEPPAPATFEEVLNADDTP